MAGSGRRVFAPGEVLTASNTMNYLMDQTVMNFAGTAARGSAIGTAVSEGMVSYLADTNSLEVYKTVGTAVAGWEPVNLAQSPNYIINGGFEINQRGFTSTTSSTFTFDRWMYQTNDGTCTASSQTFTPGSAPVAGYEATNYLRVITSGQTSPDAYTFFDYKMEDVRTLAGQTATFSFWMKAASGTPNVCLFIQQSFGTGGSASVNTIPSLVSISSSWNRYSVTVNIPSISGKTIGAGNHLLLRFWVSVGSNRAAESNSIGIQSNTFDLWGVQVEAGQTATPFRRNANSIQGELAACQRYYLSVPDETLVIQSTVQFQATLFPTTMRAAPTVTIIGTSGGGSVSVSVTTTHGFFTSNSGMTAAIGFTAAIEL
jgi:hypothetical protein